jgi:hypothetical protein
MYARKPSKEQTFTDYGVVTYESKPHPEFEPEA